MEKKNVISAIIYLLTAIAAALGIAFGLTSCTFTRVVTTSSECHQRGDTSFVIQTKTIESYKGTKEM